ncbi:MAG: hypothetical protein ACKO96_23825 [Flammeovirgaceae bacterium]
MADLHARRLEIRQRFSPNVAALLCGGWHFCDRTNVTKPFGRLHPTAGK